MGPAEHESRTRDRAGARPIDRSPTWSAGDSSIRTLDGFFVDAGPTLPIFAVAKDTRNRIAILASDDDGATWLDYALSAPIPAGYGIYAIGGGRVPGPDATMVGTFTEQDLSGTNHHVAFFRIKAEQ